MNGRQLPASDYFELKASTRRLVKVAGKSVHAASITRVAQQRLSEYGNPDAPLFMPIDVVADLEAECGPVVTAQLAALCQHVLIPLPDACRDGSVLARLTGEAMKEVSEVFVGMADAVGDGRVTPEEAVRVAHEIDEAIAKLLTLKAQLSAESERAAS